MIKIVQLKRKHLTAQSDFDDWTSVLHAIALDYFNDVPQKDIHHLLNEVMHGSAAVYVIYHNDIPAGMGAALFRSMIVNHQVYYYIVLDVGCIDSRLRGEGRLATLAMKAMLMKKSFPINHLIHQMYVLIMCMTPVAFAMFDLPHLYLSLDNLSNKKKKVVDAILLDFCTEFNLNYTAYGQPIHFNTWTPKYASLPTCYQNDKARFFIKQNPEWTQGYGLPLLFPLDWVNVLKLIQLLFRK